MNDRDAIELIREAVPRGQGVWADLGAGEGTFARALAALMAPGSLIYAVDRDQGAVTKLARRAMMGGVRIVPVVADFVRPLELPELGERKLDGLLLANALHYVPDAEAVLGRLASCLAARGRLVLVEYDRRRANPWVPYPIAIERLPSLAAAAGFSAPVVVAKRPSAFGGDLYAALAHRAGEVSGSS